MLRGAAPKTLRRRHAWFETASEESALSVRVSDRDRDAIAEKGESSVLPIAEYVRRWALGPGRRPRASMRR